MLFPFFAILKIYYMPFSTPIPHTFPSCHCGCTYNIASFFFFYIRHRHVSHYHNLWYDKKCVCFVIVTVFAKIIIDVSVTYSVIRQ